MTWGLALLALLALCVMAGIVRKARGGAFFPKAMVADGEEQPQSLKDMVEQNRRRAGR